MNRDTLRAMIKSLPDIEEDGATYTFGTQWDVSVIAGRAGAPLTVQQARALRLDELFVVLETRRGHVHVIAIDELRAFSAEPTSADRSGRKPGFV